MNQTHSIHSFTHWLAVLVLIVAATSVQALELEPEAACSVLEAKGLAARGGYEKASDSSYRCNSRRKPLNAGGAISHEIRFYALGDQSKVSELVLELAIRSLEDVQRGHRLMVEYASAMVANATQKTLPKDVENGILAGVSGSWKSDGLEYQLRRETLGAPGYDLRLRVR